MVKTVFDYRIVVKILNKDSGLGKTLHGDGKTRMEGATNGTSKTDGVTVSQGKWN